MAIKDQCESCRFENGNSCPGQSTSFDGLYDTFCNSYLGMFIALPITFIAVFLLMTYLKQGQNYQSKLIK